MKSRFSAGIIAGVLFLALVWGVAFLLMKIGRQDYNTWQLASLRLCFAGALALPFALFHFKSFTATDLKFLALAGFCGNGIPAYLFAYAGNRIPSSVSGSLNALTPLFTLLLGMYLFRNTISKKQVAGILTGLAGALLLVLTNSQQGDKPTDPLACILVIIATLLYGANINIIKTRLSHLSPVAAGMTPLVIIAIPSLFIALATGAFSVKSSGAALHIPFGAEGIHMSAFYCIAFLGMVGNSISLIVFNQVIRKTSAVFAASITYLVPFVALFWGLYDHETIGLLQQAGLALILLGITLTR